METSTGPNLSEFLQKFALQHMSTPFRGDATRVINIIHSHFSEILKSEGDTKASLQQKVGRHLVETPAKVLKQMKMEDFKGNASFGRKLWAFFQKNIEKI